MDSTARTRSRLTPTLAAIISLLLVMLTASGCQTPSITREATQRPPMEEAADVGAPASPQASDAAARDPIALSRKTPQHTTPSRPRATQVVWTTAAPSDEPPREPTIPVTFTPDAALDTALDAPLPNNVRHRPATPDAASEVSSDGVPTTSTSSPVDNSTPDSGVASNSMALFYVFGEVEHPGPYHHTGRNRVLDVIAQVKPTRRANPTQVQLVRPAPQAGQDATVWRIDVDRMIRAGDLSQNLRLEAGDILYIPPTGGAKLSLALTSLLGPPAEKDKPQNGE